MSRTATAIAIFIMSALLSAWGGAGAATLRVEKDGSGEYTVIQDALDAAAPGDTIQIGPGRYDNVRHYDLGSSGEFDAVVWVEKNDLTFRGENMNTVFLGPTTPTGNVDFNPTCIRIREVTGIRVEGVTCENMEFGLVTRGELTITDCRFIENDRDGVRNSSVYPLRVSNSYFEGNEKGVLCGPLDSNSVIQDCEFVNNQKGLNFNSSPGATVRNCRFIPVDGIAGIEFEQGATGLVEDCVIESGSGFIGLSIVQLCTVELRNNRIAPSVIGIRHWDLSHVFGSGNVFGGGSWATIECRGIPTVDLTGNDILKGEGPTILLRAYNDDPPITLNFTDNYWGTTETDSIDAWIIDGNDDPQIKGFVEYDPIRTESVPVEGESVGSLKSRFRR